MSYLLSTEVILLRILRRRTAWPLGLLSYVLRGNAGGLEIFTHMTVEERCLLYRLALRCTARPRMLEIGSYLGASACFLAAAAVEGKGSLVCVDTWMNESMSEGTRDTYEEFLCNTKKYSQWIETVRSNSVEAAKIVEGMFDLIFIDGGHEYGSIAADLRSWLPRVRYGGWIILHDTGWAEGVKQALAEFVKPCEQPGSAIVLPNMYAARIVCQSADCTQPGASCHKP